MAKNTYEHKYSIQEILNKIFDDSAYTISIAGGGSSTTDGSTFTSGSDAGSPIEGVYESSPTTIPNGKYGVVGIDSLRNLKVTLATLLAGENLTKNRIMTLNQWGYTSITTQTTTTIKSGPGDLGAILIPTPLANATIKAYDNIAGSGPVLIDTITFPGTLISDGPIILYFGGVPFSTGLTIVTAGATMAVDVYSS